MEPLKTDNIGGHLRVQTVLSGICWIIMFLEWNANFLNQLERNSLSGTNVAKSWKISEKATFPGLSLYRSGENASEQLLISSFGPVLNWFSLDTSRETRKNDPKTGLANSKIICYYLQNPSKSIDFWGFWTSWLSLHSDLSLFFRGFVRKVFCRVLHYLT